MNVYQIGAITRYELLMQWRRRLLPALLAASIAMLVFGLALQWDATQQNALVYENMDENMPIDAPDFAKSRGVEKTTVGEMRFAQATQLATDQFVFYMTMISIVGAVAFAETIPRDRQIGVRDLLDSLPFSAATYLAGKLLSVWASLLFIIAASMVCSGVFGLWLNGPFDLGAFLITWALAVVIPVLCIAGSVLLLAGGQPTRRRAAFLALAFMPVYLAAFMAGLGFLFDVKSLVNPLYSASGMGAMLALTDAQLATLIAITLGVMVFSVVLSWSGMWAWMRWQNGRS